MAKNLKFIIKKNDLDNLFINLTENPQGFENKNFRTVLSTVYELTEEEYSQTFNTSNVPLRNTGFWFLENENKFFVYPKTNFQLFLKSKGSMYRLKSDYIQIEGLGLKEGYFVDADLLWEYFCSFDSYLDFEYTTESFKFLSLLTQLGNKLIEKLCFLPKVYFSDNFFKIKYEAYLESQDVSNAFEKLCEHIVEQVAKDKKYVKKLLNNYINTQIYKFLHIKVQKFNQYKSAQYFIKNFDHKRFHGTVDIGAKIDHWLDEIYIGKYEILPLLKISEANDENFLLEIFAYNKLTKEKIKIDDLLKQESYWGKTKHYLENIIQKQLEYIIKQIEILEKAFLENNWLLSLNEVYSLITQSTYNLQKAGVELDLPEKFNNIIIPRCSINAKIKNKREEDLFNFLNHSNSGTIKLGDILKFSTEVHLGDEKLTVDEFEALTKGKSGLIQYKNMYVLLDENEARNIIEKNRNANFEEKEVSNLELLNSAFTGQLENFEFDYDEAFMKVVNNLNQNEDIEVPKSLSGTLRPYQKNGFRWLYTNAVRGFGSCIADDMGLGKTIQVISLILKLIEMKKIKSQVLIVCPTTLLGNWSKELSLFAKNLKSQIYHGADRAFEKTADIVLTTFAILRLDIDEFKKRKWSMLIVDEAQNIKNPETSQAVAVKSIKADYKIAMTGTPVENRLTELWSIFDYINKGYLGSLRDFQKSYAIPIEKFKETKRAEKLKLCVSPFVLRRLKTDKTIINDLPQKIVIDDYCYLTNQQATIYKKVLSDIMGEISNLNGINRRGMIFKLITSLKQICNHPFHYLKQGNSSCDLSGKAMKTIDLVSKIVENREKAVIFTQYKEMGKILSEMLNNELDLNPLFFHGSLARKERESMIEAFQNNEDKKIMILSLKAGGTGLNLTSATNVIHYDLWWNPAVEDQATDRTYRIGQKKNVMVHRLVTLGTFEEKIDEIIKSKQKLANMAVFEGEKVITELTDQEIMEIFSLSA